MDKQTLYDLDIFTNDTESSSVYERIHRFTLTAGGKEALQRRMREPVFAYDQVCRNQRTILHLIQHLEVWKKSFHAQEIQYLEDYLHSNITPLQETDIFHIWLYRWRYPADYAFLASSISRLAAFLQKLHPFSKVSSQAGVAEVLTNLHQIIKQIYADERKGWLMHAADDWLKPHQVFYLDHFIRFTHRKSFHFILDAFYELDALFAMAEATVKYQLAMPLLDKAGSRLAIKGLYHLFLPDAVRNDVYFDRDHPFIFLTGPNMAGKSTFLKACGIAMYLAHLGMGIPAASATIPVVDGLFTDIYVTDKIEKGYSYFFSEVQRIRQLAAELQQGKRLFVLIDEMFRGTNVQDAYDCSLAVVEKLMRFTNSYFLFASHLTELAYALQEHALIRFYCFDATVAHQQPCFSYRLKDGISSVRLGKIILEQEQVLALLDARQDTTG